jgi:hypothetical protein
MELSSRPCLVFVAAGALIALRATAQNPAVPEIEQTVAALEGRWHLTGTDTEPGAKPAPVDLVIDCKRAALGAAVSCEIAGQITGLGAVEAVAVVGYSPDEGLVRWMEISSTGEYHDHHGRWDGAAIRFEPLTYTVAKERSDGELLRKLPVARSNAVQGRDDPAAGDSVLDCMGARPGPNAQ